MDFDDLDEDVRMDIMMYVSIQDRFENARLVSKRWKSVAEDSLRRQRKLTVYLEPKEACWKIKIKPTDHHSIIKLSSLWGYLAYGTWRTVMVRYWSHIFSLCPNLEQLYMYDPRGAYIHTRVDYDISVTEFLDILQSHGIKLKSFTNDGTCLQEWPFPLGILESLAVREVSDELVVKILDEATNLKHLELDHCSNWPSFPSGLLSLKFTYTYNLLSVMKREGTLFNTNAQLSILMNLPAFHTIESLEGLYFNEEFDPQNKVFPKLRRVSFDFDFSNEESCQELCNKLVTFLVEQIPLLESLGLHFTFRFGLKKAVDILFSIPQFVDVLRRLKKLDIDFNEYSTTVNILNVLRSCQNTELSMVDFNCFGEDGNLLNDLLSFLVDMSGNIKHFSGYTYEQPVKVSDLDVLRQLHTSHETVLQVREERESSSPAYHINIQNCVTEQRDRRTDTESLWRLLLGRLIKQEKERQKYVVAMEITAR